MSGEHIQRTRQVVAVFAKYGFRLMSDQVSQALPWGSPGQGGTIGRRLRLALEELGPTFMKMGQLMSTRADLFSEEIVEELKLLQDAAPPVSYPDIRAMVEQEFGAPVETIFAEFQPEPLAAASLSQVHRARLADGQVVAVKVQRPGIDEQVRTDLEILTNIVQWLSRHTRANRSFDGAGMIEEFSRSLAAELDFLQEGENADHFAQNFRQDKGIAVPRVRWVYTTRRVLTMEYVPGVSLRDVETLRQWGVDRDELARRLAASVCNQILRDGFFHADPHPGNVQVTPDGTIYFLDLGMVGYLDDARRNMLVRFFLGMVSRDSRMVAEALASMDTSQDIGSHTAFERDIDKLINKYLTISMTDIRIDRVVGDTFRLAYQNHVKIPREFALLAKTMATLQAALETLSPQLNPLTVAEPIARKLVVQSFSPQKMKEDLLRSFLGYRQLALTLPDLVLRLLRRAGDGELSLQVELKEADKLQQRLERITNRLSLTIILLAVSIFITGIVISSGMSASLNAEMAGFYLTVLRISLVLALLIVLSLVISMVRSRH